MTTKQKCIFLDRDGVINKDKVDYVYKPEELFIIESYLPKQMSETEIVTKIQELLDGGASNIADIMRAFATLPADRQTVASIYHSLK